MYFTYVKNNNYNPAMEEGDNPRHDDQHLNFKNHLHKGQCVNKTATYWYCKTSGCSGSVAISTEEEVVNSTSCQRLRLCKRNCKITKITKKIL